jgi:CDP-glucose 4,6-dehydratase
VGNPDVAFWQSKRVLLTGHTGFKGAWLALWLQRLGATVRGFALPPDTAPSLCDAANVEHACDSVRGDIRNSAGLRDALVQFAPDIVLHLAAQALVRRGYDQPAATFATNVMGTVHLLDAATAAPSVRAIVVVTSDKCYENREWPWPYRETDTLGGHDPYSASKACAELVAAAWRRSYPGPAIATVRAGNVIGGGDWAEGRLVPDCVRALGADAPVPIRHPDAVRPWQHVLEPLCGYLLLAEHLWRDPLGAAEAWNFGPAAEDARPVRDVADLVCRHWGQGARWLQTGTQHPHEAWSLTVDAAKARARLGWQPRLGLAEALEWTVRWYKQHAAGAPAQRLVARDIDAYEARAA